MHCLALQLMDCRVRVEQAGSPRIACSRFARKDHKRVCCDRGAGDGWGSVRSGGH